MVLEDPKHDALSPATVDASSAKIRDCPACGSGQQERLQEYTVTEWPVAQCGGCGFVFLSRIPDDSALFEEHAWEKNWAKERKRRKRSLVYRIDHATRFRLAFGRWLDAQAFLPSAKSGDRVLDIGCGGGCRIPERFVPFGIEISKALAEAAEPMYSARGGRLINAPAADGLLAFEDGFFDRAVLRSYLEHESRPRLVLERLRRKMKPSGVIALKVPDFDCYGRKVMGARWCGFRFPDHQNYFTPKSLARLAADVGLDCRIINWVPGVNDNIYAVLTVRAPG